MDYTAVGKILQEILHKKITREIKEPERVSWDLDSDWLWYIGTGRLPGLLAAARLPLGSHDGNRYGSLTGGTQGQRLSQGWLTWLRARFAPVSYIA